MIKPNTITAEYLCALQATYHYIERRGIMVCQPRLKQARTYIDQDIKDECGKISSIWGVHVYVGADNDDGSDWSVNLNASSGKRTPLIFMRDTLKYDIPKISVRDEDGNYIGKESLGELTLQKMYALNQFAIAGGDPAIKSILRIRELVTIKNRYVNADLYDCDGSSVFLSNYNVVGTLSGRRGSKKHVFGLGGNAQNFPKHGELAKIYRRCLVSRPGKLFLSVDQMQAEDWPVSCLAGNTNSLKELTDGVDRHKMLACGIFNIAPGSKTEKEWKDSMERFLGKKTRHANNYDMRGGTMSDSLAKEQVSLSAAVCQTILDKVNQIDPSVKGVFHVYVREQLNGSRTLRTPYGRERQFFGLRSGDGGGNNKIYREAYSYIPQSTVGDNTGFAVYHLENAYSDAERCIVQEGHDSIVQEIDNGSEAIWSYVQRTITAFDRTATFYNGLSCNIPVEGEIGFDMAHTVTLKSIKTGSKKLTDLTYQDIQVALYKLQERQEIEMQKDNAYAVVTNTKSAQKS